MQGWRDKNTNQLFRVQQETVTLDELLSALGGGDPDDFEFVEDITLDMIPVNIETVRSQRKQSLNDEMHDYLASVGYDPDSQSTLLALQGKLDKIVRKGGTLTDEQDAADDALDAVWEFIESVLDYYKERKETLDAAEDPEIITWDYTQFNTLHPQETLWTIKERL